MASRRTIATIVAPDASVQVNLVDRTPVLWVRGEGSPVTVTGVKAMEQMVAAMQRAIDVARDRLRHGVQLAIEETNSGRSPGTYNPNSD